MIDPTTHRNLRIVRERGGRSRFDLLERTIGFWGGFSDLHEPDAFARRQMAIAEMNADPEFSGDSTGNWNGTIEDDVSGRIYGDGPVETFAGCFV
jgi:hypothetical protein